MKKFLGGSIIVLVIVAGALYYYLGIWHGTHSLAADAYPLYTGLQWGSSHTATVGDIEGAQADSAPVTNITDIAAVSAPFEQYYRQKLDATGWTVDNSLAAGGPGAEVTAYKKGNDYIIISFNSVFHIKPADAPEQCPCDVSFSVFSGTK